MTETARRLLVECGACPEEKVRVVPHGAPARLDRARAERAASDGPTSRAVTRRTTDRFLLSTFGLISPGKGLETVIEALPAIVERHPEIVYVIAGRTHPDVARREGERYRLMLERRVLELGLGDHVEFDDRFLSIDELADLLAATDVFVTPYRNREQIASGALTFAIAAGCAVVSTPYWYAQDMLASGAGTLVPFDDPAALADAVCELHRASPETLAAARAEARRIGSTLAWPSVAEATAAVLREAVALAPRRRPVGRRRAAAHEPAHRPPAHARRRRRHRAARARDHPEPRQRLLRRRRRPARGRLARARAPRRRAGLDVDPLPRRSRSCTRPTGDGGMRNFMGYDRRWLDEPHVGDHVGRSVWALGEILATAWIPAVVGPARDLLDRLVGTLAGDVSLRTAAYTVLGLVAPRRRPARAATRARCSSASSSSSPTPTQRNASDDWRWFEDELTLRQRAALAGADRRRQRARSRRRSPSSGSSRSAGSATSRGLDGRRAAADRATTAGAGASRPRAPATSSRSTRPLVSRPGPGRQGARAPGPGPGRHRRARTRRRASEATRAPPRRGRRAGARPAGDERLGELVLEPVHPLVAFAFVRVSELLDEPLEQPARLWIEAVVVETREAEHRIRAGCETSPSSAPTRRPSNCALDRLRRGPTRSRGSRRVRTRCARRGRRCSSSSQLRS